MAFFPGVTVGGVTVGDQEVKFYDSGHKHISQSERTVVLCHGTGGSAEGNFWALFPMLAMRHRVVAFEFVDPTEELGPDEMAAHYVSQVSAVIRTVSPETPVELVGYSFGAVIAAKTAAENPTAVHNLVLIAGWLVTDTQQRLRNDVWFALHDSGHRALADFTVFTQYSQQFVNSRLPHELENERHKVLTGGPDRAAKMRFNRSVDISDAAESITAPTLVIGCTQDQVAPIRHSYLLFGAISDARLVEVDSGHGVLTERPSEVFILIDDFVREPHAVAAGGVLENDHA
ncbi:alpha/beta hydrolase [Rhodococcus sp. T2V]|uniref:alpha/beta fold hydrolase n=1 Tax=Rhodococcus sp. T2V TaxID=3034164 RepID=UPI0023E2C1EF|nr:alpha/beta hydrolase [Rhodococcus sp. T2V]MDF3311373.1 alpha/beta hydrolase [Rhodococcus sp. T2V]